MKVVINKCSVRCSICFKAGSHDPTFSLALYQVIKMLIRASVTSLNLSKNRIRKWDRVNQPLQFLFTRAIILLKLQTIAVIKLKNRLY